MGSKKLKGILVRGTGNVQVAEPDRFQTLWQDAHQRVQENPQALEMRKYGTPILVATKQTIGELPTHNHREGIFEGWEQISAETLHDEYFATTRACSTCRLACKKAFRVDEGPYAGLITEGPEYEGLMAMGSNVGINDIPTILTTFRTQVNYPICVLDHIHVVLYDEHCIALAYKPPDYGNELLYVSKMKACRGFIKDKERGTLTRGSQITRKLKSLSLSP